jgi:hypothetical protein
MKRSSDSVCPGLLVSARIAFVLMFAAGCARIHAPKFSPRDAAAKALEQYDTNHDGRLDAAELERCPALKHSLPRFDKDGDGFLTVDEIADRLAMYRRQEVGLVAVSCRALMDGRPLAGAEITFVPEAFLGPAAKPAVGTTNGLGHAVMTVENSSLLGAPPGLYRIEVSTKNAAGEETLPARYNVQTVLGEEVAADLPSSGISLHLKSR